MKLLGYYVLFYIALIHLIHDTPFYENVLCVGYYVWFEK